MIVDWDQVYKELSRRNWITLFVLSAVSYFFFSSALTFGIIAGGFTVIINLHFFQKTIRGAFSIEKEGTIRKSALLIKGFLRLTALGVVLYLLVVSLGVHPVGLAIGFSTVVISILSLGISNATKLMMRGVA
jgi:hypothetical protein